MWQYYNHTHVIVGTVNPIQQTVTSPKPNLGLFSTYPKSTALLFHACDYLFLVLSWWRICMLLCLMQPGFSLGLYRTLCWLDKPRKPQEMITWLQPQTHSEHRGQEIEITSPDAGCRSLTLCQRQGSASKVLLAWKPPCAQWTMHFNMF